MATHRRRVRRPRAGEAPTDGPPLFGPLALAGLSSLAAGAIHGAAVGVHRQDRQAAVAFAVLGAVQLVWGALALAHRGRPLALLGVVIGSTALGGWVLAKTRGIGAVAGLAEVEAIQWSDATAAALAFAGALLALRHLAVGPADAHPPRPALARGATAVLTVVTMAAMVAAPGHAHGGHEDDDHRHGPGARPTRPYDPARPVDLSGAATVSAAEQARAEDLVRRTLAAAPRFADRAAVEAEGFSSMGDAASGYEHLYRPSSIDDDVTLDPDAPEGLVYAIDDRGAARLAGVLYLLAPRTPIGDAPDLGGALTIWSLRRDLCFGATEATAEAGAPAVARSDATGACPDATTAVPPTAELPLWVVANPCGPFVAPSLTGDECR